MKRFNVRKAETYPNDGQTEGFDASWASIHRAIGAEHIAGNVIKVAPGAKAAPYHWEASQEEWLLVLSGTPTVRTPEGEGELRAGDVTAFTAGPDGAHQVLNRSDREATVVIISNVARPEVIVYPDSGKVGVTSDHLNAMLPLEAEVDYWEGE